MKYRPLRRLANVMLAPFMLATALVTVAAAKDFTLQMQTSVTAGSPHDKLLKQFADRVDKMSGGSIKIRVLANSAVVDFQEIPDAVNRGLVEMGFAWTHYYTGRHPAAGLFSAPIGGAGTGLDQMGHLSWLLQGEGGALLNELYQKELKLDVVSFMVIPDGPEALGWFKKPVTSMDEFRKLKFRAPPGLPGEAYSELGMSVVSMLASELLPALERGVVDAGEWINPASDMDIGFQDVAKYYSLQGLHQAVDVAQIMINGKTWRSMSPAQQAIIQVAAEATIAQSLTHFVKANSEALEILQTKHGVKLFEPPAEYPPEFLKAATKVLSKYRKDPFFDRVLKSIEAFAETAVKYRVETLKQSLFMSEAGLAARKKQ
jgi:TRAP-type mannitol/chloroaromatic compound transport system substrate-binding protein